MSETTSSPSGLRTFIVGAFLVVMFLLGPLLVHAIDQGWLPRSFVGDGAPAPLGHAVVAPPTRLRAESDAVARLHLLEEQIAVLQLRLRALERGQSDASTELTR